MCMINKVENNLSFTGLKVKPAFHCWDRDILEATLNSKYIKDIIAADAKNGKDTFISYADKYILGPIGGPNWYEQSLKIKGAGKDIKLESSDTEIWNPAYDVFSTIPLARTGEDIGKDLVSQIYNLDKSVSKSEKTIIENYKEIKSLAGDIEFIKIPERNLNTENKLLSDILRKIKSIFVKKEP